MEANLCIFFNRSFMYVMPLEFQLSRARTEVLFTGITLPHSCACPNPGPGFPSSYVVGCFFVFNALRW